MVNERQQQILDLFDTEEFIRVNEISDALKVSAVTIRKDLSFLESKSLLYRTHGGARKQSSFAFEKNISEKEEVQVEQKIAIAKKAATLIQDHDFVILASGTTLHHLARNLLDFSKLTVLTSSLKVGLELCDNEKIDIIQLGGDVRKSSGSVVGPFSETILKQFSCNKLFLGVDGIDFDFGLSTSNAMEAHLNLLMINSADKVYILADSTKINKRGFGKICEIHKMDALITDSGISAKDFATLSDMGIEVIIAD
ncbi:DeoR family transcriptional regulator [Epilithonimonas vandammei]|mgnify:FL=1|uniref:DeoR family transcriptional regulator n=3 Tax=Bacteroidota TaxID=976 RepID=A0A3G8ZBY0_9FLAO|nr:MULTISPECIES: DeoR/GlpR family DNA-binding transcription regulator [Epilithonimonas]AZI38450.1 DeoR family transcriptional regulator [Epilithonimonas vandammei]AZI54215.1 DeoR family transcriptional regulator [Epilithonimonas vandammei]ROI12878.1 DeoR/GlpR transcriptional regulator [Epilithonimonas hominis]